jgi:dTMP kinase
MEKQKGPVDGLFVVFEGPDGSGTTTQAKHLQEALSREYTNVYTTSEPTLGPVGNLIRLIMTHRLNVTSDEDHLDRQLAHLFAADRYDHLYNEVDGILHQMRLEGAIIISTRYYLSSYAYHCRQPSDFEFVERLNRDFPPADITFYLNCPVSVCLERINQRQYKNEKYETADKLPQVISNYERAISNYPYELHILDGTEPYDLLHQKIIETVRRKL